MSIIRSLSFFTKEPNDHTIFYVNSDTVMPGTSTLPHAHDFVELVFISKGAGEHLYKNEVYTVSKGDTFVIEPGQVHNYRVDAAEPPLTLYNVIFYPSLIKGELDHLAFIDSFMDFFYIEPYLRSKVKFKDKLSLKPSEQLEVLNLIHRLMYEFDQCRSGFRSVTKAKLIELLVFISRCYEEVLHKPMTTGASAREIMIRITEFIAHHYNQNLTLLQLSKMCGMSQTSFSVKFKEHTGKTFIEYRNQIRIENACHFLMETDGKILHISQKVGFEDVSFFNKFFRKIKGTSPGEYRKAMLNERM